MCSCGVCRCFGDDDGDVGAAFVVASFVVSLFTSSSISRSSWLFCWVTLVVVAVDDERFVPRGLLGGGRRFFSRRSCAVPGLDDRKVLASWFCTIQKGTRAAVRPRTATTCQYGNSRLCRDNGGYCWCCCGVMTTMAVGRRCFDLLFDWDPSLGVSRLMMNTCGTNELRSPTTQCENRIAL